MRVKILAVDDLLPDGPVDQIWYFVDRRDYASNQRCSFRNSAIVERNINALISNRPDIRACPGDFYFAHVADQVLVDGVCYIKYLSGDEIKEIKDYAS